MNYDEVKQYILKKSRKCAVKAGDRLPSGTTDGQYNYSEDCGWTGGFWVGLMNYCCLFSGDKEYFEFADKSRRRFTDRLYLAPETLDHDVGFLYLPSEYARYKLRGDEEGLKNTLAAAERLYERYNEKGKFIRAWNVRLPLNPFQEDNKGRIIIDCMYNLPLLFIASEHTGDKKYYNAALNHADTCLKNIVRPDGTTYHSFLFNPETGEPRYGQTCQGYADDSCWSRGQAWAIGGFAYAYRYTGKKRFLDASKKTADVFINNLEDDCLPKWDFALKGRDDMPCDASAAAIAASGLFDLAALSGEEKYKDMSEKLLAALWDKCLADDSQDGLITRCVGFYKFKRELNENLVFADYYFAEAVAKHTGIKPLL